MRNFLENLFKAVTPETEWGRFSALIILICTALGFAFLLESYTGYLYYNRMEHRIYLLKEVSEINPSQFENSRLEKVYNQIIDNLLVERTDNIISVESLYRSYMFQKFAAGAGIFLIFALVALFKEDDTDTLYGMIIFGLVGGVINVFIPTIWSKWVNLLVLPIIYLILTALYGMFVIDN